jgi:hypothetical protein
MTLHAKRLHMPIESPRGLFVSLVDAQKLYGNDVMLTNNHASKKIVSLKPNRHKSGQRFVRFAMKHFGICTKVDVGIQSNAAGKLFLRSFSDLVTVSTFDNPLRDPISVIYCRNSKRYFLRDGFHRLFECARRGYKGYVYAQIFDGDVDACPVKAVFPCAYEKKTEYVDDIL